MHPNCLIVLLEPNPIESLHSILIIQLPGLFRSEIGSAFHAGQINTSKTPFLTRFSRLSSKFHWINFPTPNGRWLFPLDGGRLRFSLD